MAKKNIHPSIFYTRLIRRSGRGGPGAYPSGHRARGTRREPTHPRRPQVGIEPGNPLADGANHHTLW